jgi:hypothetical protein
MNNPWLSIPLEEYEGHMALPDLGQAKMLSNEFEELLRTYSPVSAALIGCAGGNGFEEAHKAGVILGVSSVSISIRHTSQMPRRATPVRYRASNSIAPTLKETCRNCALSI